jgi:inner membrane protein
VDNITHSLVGVVLADAMAGRRATKSQRPLLVGAGIIAANLPDIDIAYAAITPSPIGYLLHHRGHTHTVVGLGVLALVLVLAYRLVPPVRSMRASDRARFWLLITVALASHLALDALNTYGVHPFYPVDNHWYYGDSVFVFEPWLWLVLGIAVAWNGRSGTSRLSVAVPLLILMVTISSLGIVPIESIGAIAVAGALLAWFAQKLSPRARAGAALAAMVAVIAALFGVSREAGAGARRALQPLVRGQMADVILMPNPASPLCWGVIAIESNGATGEYVLWRGTLSLAPALKAPTDCASHRFAEVRHTRVVGDGHLALGDEIHQSLGALRDLARRDCWARAWLRFGRAPVAAGGEIFDLRFAERRAQEFTQMPLARDRDAPCPSFVPEWEMPRKDLIEKGW